MGRYKETLGRGRMILDLPPLFQMAIRLRAVKNGMTTGEVVAIAVQKTFEEDIVEAKQALAEQNKEEK